tara:strand:+ start:1332 stop:1694 length:363 start_codon:yes stop_codon:yes gene_type:complete
MKAKSTRCCNCNEKIVRGMAFPLMDKSLCMGCFVEFGLAQKLDLDIEHYMNCSEEYCFECDYAFTKALWALDYKQTEMGNWYRRTPDPKIVRIYDDLLTNLPTSTGSKMFGNLQGVDFVE